MEQGFETLLEAPVMEDAPRISLSVIIPVRDSSAHLRHCLEALLASQCPPREILVVDDGSMEPLPAVAYQPPCRILTSSQGIGSYAARNQGAAAAEGEVLVFIDADVVVGRETLGFIRRRMEEDPQLSAVFGCYDDAPADTGLVSQYRNLLHAYIHRTSRPQASTFWTGCGAIRREVFEEFGGFALDRQFMRDVELGIRLWRARRRILLDASLLVKHRKRWTLGGMLRTDVLHRGAHWTEIVLHERSMPNDLNLRFSERACVVAVFSMVAVATAAAGNLVFPARGVETLGLFLAAYAALNLRFFKFLGRVKGLRFAVRSVPLHFIYHFSCGLGFLIGLGRHLAERERLSRAGAAVQLQGGD